MNLPYEVTLKQDIKNDVTLSLCLDYKTALCLVLVIYELL